MGLEYPFFLANCKTYEGTAGENALSIARTIDRVRDETGARFVLAPQTPDLRWLADRTAVPLVAQRAVPREDASIGDATLETVAAAGADAAFLSHPELEVGLNAVGRAVDRCRDLGLESIVWASDRETVRAALAFDPDCLLFERPADIASDDGLVRTDPDRIEGIVESVAEVNPRTRVFVGGGIRSAADVERAFARGVDATGAASAAVEAPELESWLRSIAAAVPGGLE